MDGWISVPINLMDGWISAVLVGVRVVANETSS
jgi:hypothetical protein